MEVFAFAGFILLDLLAFAFLRLRLASNGSEKGLAKGSPSVIDYRKIIRIASFLTLGIANACLLIGLSFLIGSKTDASPLPRSDPFPIMTITGIGFLLTLATWVGALVVAALVATIRAVGEFIDAALGLLLLHMQRDGRRASPKPPRITCGSGGVVDEWLDGP